MKDKILQGDCIEVLKTLPDNCVDSVVTDPPYDLTKPSYGFERGKQDNPFGRTVKGGFMGKEWDGTGIAFKTELWKEVFRVLKPGGHLLSFGGTRTYHRMACAIEDAGFEIRDCIQWLYGSGFPKSLNIGKQIDKIAGRNSEKEKEISGFLKNRRLELGLSMKEVEDFMGWNTWLNWVEGRNYKGDFIIKIPNWKDYQKLKQIYSLDSRFDEFIKEAEREVIGKKTTNITVMQNIGQDNISGEVDVTVPATDEAKFWEGWGTALKPANEPVVVARKPLGEKNVALNVLKWGVGGLNIDDCRIEGQGSGNNKRVNSPESRLCYGEYNKLITQQHNFGRFPANVILDDSISTEWSRFFYCAKASKSERGSFNKHPTVKPVKLMQYLVRLVTPKGGLVLDPFGGSGTTGIACLKENMNYLLIEKEEEYIGIAKARIEPFKKQKRISEYE